MLKGPWARKSKAAILINAASRRQAVLALANELGGFNCQTEADRLMNALEQHHSAIAGSFYTGAGLRLQRCDSDLIIRILQQCLVEGIVALPIHDSLIVPSGRSADRAYEIMLEQLSRLIGATC